MVSNGVEIKQWDLGGTSSSTSNYPGLSFSNPQKHSWLTGNLLKISLLFASRMKFTKSIKLVLCNIPTAMLLLLLLLLLLPPWLLVSTFPSVGSPGLFLPIGRVFLSQTCSQWVSSQMNVIIHLMIKMINITCLYRMAVERDPMVALIAVHHCIGECYMKVKVQVEIPIFGAFIHKK